MSRLTFAPLREGDLAMLREGLLRPHVAKWWGRRRRSRRCAATTALGPRASRPQRQRRLRKALAIRYTRAGFRPVGRVDTPDGAALRMRCTRHTLAQDIAAASS